MPPFTRATRRLCAPRAGRCGWVSVPRDAWGAWARHQQHPGRGYAGEPTRQQSCAQTSAPPQWGTSGRCTHWELKKNQLNTAMGSIRVPSHQAAATGNPWKKFRRWTRALKLEPGWSPGFPQHQALWEGSTQQPCSKADPPELHSERQSQNLLQNQSDSKIFHNNILFPPILFSLQCDIWFSAA